MENKSLELLEKCLDKLENKRDNKKEQLTELELQLLKLIDFHVKYVPKGRGQTCLLK